MSRKIYIIFYLIIKTVGTAESGQTEKNDIILMVFVYLYVKDEETHLK